MTTERTQVVATGAIGPKGPPGDPGPQGDPGPIGPRGFGNAVFSMPSIVAVQPGLQRFMIVGTLTITGIIASVGQVPTGDDLIIDVNVNGSSAFSDPASQPTIGDGSHDTGVVVPSITALSEGDYITVDVDQVGSTFPGSDLTVQVVLQ